MAISVPSTSLNLASNTRFQSTPSTVDIGAAMRVQPQFGDLAINATNLIATLKTQEEYNNGNDALNKLMLKTNEAVANLKNQQITGSEYQDKLTKQLDEIHKEYYNSISKLAPNVKSSIDSKFKDFSSTTYKNMINEMVTRTFTQTISSEQASISLNVDAMANVSYGSKEFNNYLTQAENSVNKILDTQGLNDTKQRAFQTKKALSSMMYLPLMKSYIVNENLNAAEALFNEVSTNDKVDLETETKMKDLLDRYKASLIPSGGSGKNEVDNLYKRLSLGTATPEQIITIATAKAQEIKAQDLEYIKKANEITGIDWRTRTHEEYEKFRTLHKDLNLPDLPRLNFTDDDYYNYWLQFYNNVNEKGKQATNFFTTFLSTAGRAIGAYKDAHPNEDYNLADPETILTKALQAQGYDNNSINDQISYYRNLSDENKDKIVSFITGNTPKQNPNAFDDLIKSSPDIAQQVRKLSKADFFAFGRKSGFNEVAISVAWDNQNQRLGTQNAKEYNDALTDSIGHILSFKKEYKTGISTGNYTIGPRDIYLLTEQFIQQTVAKAKKENDKLAKSFNNEAAVLATVMYSMTDDDLKSKFKDFLEFAKRNWENGRPTNFNNLAKLYFTGEN